jgi:hypothetical protein
MLQKATIAVGRRVDWTVAVGRVGSCGGFGTRLWRRWMARWRMGRWPARTGFWSVRFWAWTSVAGAYAGYPYGYGGGLSLRLRGVWRGC